MYRPASMQLRVWRLVNRVNATTECHGGGGNLPGSPNGKRDGKLYIMS